MKFEFNKLHNFPPFYTKQPNPQTLARQLNEWCVMTKEYCRFHKIYRLDVEEAQHMPLFNNTKIARKLGLDMIRLVIEELARAGNAKITKTGCFVYWRTIEEWGLLIYAWIQESGQQNTVLTFFEIAHGENAQQQEFYNLDDAILTKALLLLVKQRKADKLQIGTSLGFKFY